MRHTDDTAVLCARGLRKHYGTGAGVVRVVDETGMTSATLGDLGALAGLEG